MILSRYVSLVCAFFLTGCTQAGFFVANIPAHFSKVQIEKNVVFDKDHDLSLDIYKPVAMTDKASVIVFFYGGRWTEGSKDDYQFVGTAFAEQGFVVVIPDYRKYPDVRFPAFAEDAARAVAWVSDHIDEHGGDKTRINLAGHSSGAHIAALITTNASYLKKLGKNRDEVIKSFAGLAGPYDFTPDEADLKDMFGPPERYPLMRPTTYADAHTPPLLLLHGEDDTTVGKFNYEHLAAKIEAAGGCVTTKLYPGISHVGIVAALSWAGKDKAPVLKDMVAFFKSRQNALQGTCP